MSQAKAVSVLLALILAGPAPGARAQGASEETLIKDGIVMMIKAGLPPSVIINKSRSFKTRITKKEGIRRAQRYLKIRDTKKFCIQVEEALITTDTYNTYRRLEKGIRRAAWVVTFAVPDAVGAGRTVYIDKETGEVLGGFSSK